jgi:uncharacterized protein YhfF
MVTAIGPVRHEQVQVSEESQVTDDDAVERFWQRYLLTRPDGVGLRYFEAFGFGNTPEMADELADLVLRGIKTATSGLLWEYEDRQKPRFVVGDLHIVLSGAGKPLAVIETVELRIVPFSEIDAAFARDYGEGNRTLAWWQSHLWEYDVEECAALGRTPSPDMPLICERFKVVYHE